VTCTTGTGGGNGGGGLGGGGGPGGGGVNGAPVAGGVGLVVTGLPLWARRRLRRTRKAR
jgi:hypothetical protein